MFDIFVNIVGFIEQVLILIIIAMSIIVLARLGCVLGHIIDFFEDLRENNLSLFKIVTAYLRKCDTSDTETSSNDATESCFNNSKKSDDE